MQCALSCVCKQTCMFNLEYLRLVDAARKSVHNGRAVETPDD